MAKIDSLRLKQGLSALAVILLFMLAAPAHAQEHILLHAHAAGDDTQPPAQPTEPVILPDSPQTPVAAPPQTTVAPVAPITDSPFTPAPQAIFSNNPQSPEANEQPTDQSLNTHQAAVECATAILVESAGKQGQQFDNPAAVAFKAGVCTGKIQTYMLAAQAAHPDCFPKIGLEEGIRLFVKWVEAHPGEGATPYPQGMREAFEDTVPCLRK